MSSPADKTANDQPETISGQASPLPPSPTALTVGKILEAEQRWYSFTPTRYPSTYARDFFRGHAVAFGLPANGSLSRGECGEPMQALAATNGETYGQVMVSLAEGYLAQEHIRATTAERTEALVDYIVECWKVFSLTQAPDRPTAEQMAARLIAAATRA